LLQQSFQHRRHIESRGYRAIKVIKNFLPLSLFVNLMFRYGGFGFTLLQRLRKIVKSARHLSELAPLIGQLGTRTQVAASDLLRRRNDVSDSAQNENVGTKPCGRQC
jgi:hypothetical protein